MYFFACKKGTTKIYINLNLLSLTTALGQSLNDAQQFIDSMYNCIFSQYAV